VGEGWLRRYGESKEEGTYWGGSRREGEGWGGGRTAGIKDAKQPEGVEETFHLNQTIGWDEGKKKDGAWELWKKIKVKQRQNHHKDFIHGEGETILETRVTRRKRRDKGKRISRKKKSRTCLVPGKTCQYYGKGLAKDREISPRKCIPDNQGGGKVQGGVLYMH